MWPLLQDWQDSNSVLTLDGEQKEVVEKFVYPGSCTSVGGDATLNPAFVLLGTRQQGVPVILRELVLPGGFDPLSPSFTTELFGPRLTEL
ncbi:unnamed protein product [Schistosoma margrebowiei]|uniref:Uncharacterized protein n=1 Tax=Schistosoma margrebowiei TaxID=48269 RepID=A0A183LPK8_9TREM|nr:unnamed protein product [Schistosoma margrebowiei]